MKNLKLMMMTLMMCLVTVVSFGQNDSLSDNTIQYCKDVMTDREYVYFKNRLLCSEDGKRGFTIRVNIKIKDGKIKYDGITVKSVGIGNCVEKDVIIFLLEDSSKVKLVGWNDFNCKGDSYFDLYGKDFTKINSSKIKTIRFQNGRDYESFTYNLRDDEQEYLIKIKELIDKNEYIKVDCK